MSDVVAIKDQVEAAVQAALSQVLPAELAGTDPVVRRSDRADFQANGTLAVAKKAARSPRDIGADVAGRLTGLTAEVSGPGFLNITVPDELVWSAVSARLADDRLGLTTPRSGERVVVDYSAPNVAKEMHVGHLRSSVIGDALVRVLSHLGADVTRQNHIGDWGTQFGMLIQYLDEHPQVSWKGRGAETMSALDGLYKTARAEFEADPAFADRSRARVVALQSGDDATLSMWRDLVAESEKAFEVIYDRLGILLDGGDFDGESRYNDALSDVVDHLLRTGIATESDGAVVAFTDGVTGPDGDPVPLIVRKKDGGFGYAATDLATLRLRVDHYKADRILYVVDVWQALHFRMVFDIARRAGWLPDTVQAEHVPFGTVLGTDGRPFKTRSGKTVRLADLLDDAEAAIRAVLEAKEHDFADAELDAVVHAAGMAAIKYADLSNTRTKDYVFDVDQMVATTGNTGVYLQYAHARVRSILRKASAAAPAQLEPMAAGSAAANVMPVDITLPAHPTEKALALILDAFDATLRDVALALEPHRLCGYLYDVATAFTRFYDACPVMKADDDAVRANRLALCDLTGQTLATGLDLLGIRAPQRM
ncbi:arginyl-tRNA synthetase [Promicromonospora sp. AC04]|uniref:arginine--tRNA ligase n=1 Tax=Promicromonospora sp. AC04 TaxID=2135723 RepID=UPI000D348801|nr:arginine--tRNA ligase [Promicromonospora sp. AC04]PUB24362.1 arginyl-tRNA synthetase [Promicromonospora sp. AC04]